MMRKGPEVPTRNQGEGGSGLVHGMLEKVIFAVIVRVHPRVGVDLAVDGITDPGVDQHHATLSKIARAFQKLRLGIRENLAIIWRSSTTTPAFLMSSGNVNPSKPSPNK